MSTPLMKQYYKIKQKYPDTILLFRMGDFYETFEDDAVITSKVLGITLTKRAHGASGDVPLAGFPHHALDSYLPKLIRAGYRVAICEQLEDPKFAKGIVKRDVIEVVTPGVAFSEKLLDHKSNNYLCGIYIKDDKAGIAFADVSTGEFYTTEIPFKKIKETLESITPAEVLISKRELSKLQSIFDQIPFKFTITKVDDWIFSYEYCFEILTMNFKTTSLKGFGIDNNQTEAIIAAGVVLHYLQETQKANLSHIKKLSLYNPTDFMILDPATKRNLEILASMSDGSRAGSLISILDKTKTSMGGRLLKKWVSLPLLKLEQIQNRLEAVDELFQNENLRNQLAEELKQIGDLERIISKICTGRANPRDVINLKLSLKRIPVIKDILRNVKSLALQKIRDNLIGLTYIVDKIETMLVDDPPLNIADGGVIKAGFNAELDELRNLSTSGKDYLAQLQARERERTQIPSLKVAYNKVFGYYIEVSNAHKNKVPQDYIRKQTLVNAERYITPELKQYEEKILNAEERIYQLETEFFNELRITISDEAEKVQKNAQLIAALDCFLSFAEVAIENNYVKPEVNDDDAIIIKNGRHPVVEKILPYGEKFTPNDTYLDNSTNQIMIITGPNMSGKSVYLRQVGLIVLLAQIGSFVPAESARIGIVDKIFARVGASDNLAAGESTFLVEMHETANIVNNATPKSLILLDEVGRGTSTFDGLSIAWALTEYLHENINVAAKTLFATHYHELNELANIYPRIVNYKVDVKEVGDKVIFLHKVVPGYADHSYGIQVAEMAGLPFSITKRAKQILKNLESKELSPLDHRKKKPKEEEEEIQLSLFEIRDDPLRKELEELEIEKLTPIEALIKLNELKNKTKQN
ncbi:MAG: DNA mismatch repair protein MutS [Ignavibacteria bacterium]|jgi:DNA mismatch repair protein MutS|nr:DNA mismatch repair protein MutS [Ignavibacteria bacterium]MDH7528503.1 DNA mismatch repair protein MutS [Ignavibacteria bacterium]